MSTAEEFNLIPENQFIKEPGPSIFCLPSDKAETTPLKNEREKNIYSESNGPFAAKTVKDIFA